MAIILLLHNILIHKTLRLYMLLSVTFAEKPYKPYTYLTYRLLFNYHKRGGYMSHSWISLSTFWLYMQPAVLMVS